MKDGLLVSLVGIAEGEEPFEIDVTLLVGGFLVSGSIISAEKFMENHPASRPFWKQVKELRGEAAQSGGADDVTRHFIHLRDARFYTPGEAPIPDNQGVYWRAPLESVQGFNFGLLSGAVG